MRVAVSGNREDNSQMLDFGVYKKAARIAGLLLVIATLATVAFAAKNFVLPRASTARTYPAHDEHPTEKVTIAVDPYDNVEKAKIFNGQYLSHQMLPVFFVITNDSDEPVSLAKFRVQFVTRDRAKTSPATEDDIFRRITSTKKMESDSRGAKTIPIPFPTKSKRAVPKETSEEIETALFRAKAVEPHATQSGFLFFDTGDLEDPLRGASLYVTGVRDNSGQDLMYFEISLEKYVNAKAR